MNCSISLKRSITKEARSTPCFANLTRCAKRSVYLDARLRLKRYLASATNAMSETNKPSLPVFGLLPIAFTLELVGEHNGATAIARSALVDGRRTIRIGLCQEHLIVSRALSRSDSVVLRFLIALSLVEFCLFWGDTRDGASVRNELKRLGGFTPGSQAWGTSFASGLAISEPMRVVDTLPIFGRSPEAGPFPLLEFEAPMRSPSDIRNWQARNGQAEVLKPLPPKAPKTVNVSSEDTVIAPAASPDPFLTAFHRAAKEMLSAEDFAVLEELAKGGPADV